MLYGRRDEPSSRRRRGHIVHGTITPDEGHELGTNNRWPVDERGDTLQRFPEGRLAHTGLIVLSLPRLEPTRTTLVGTTIGPSAIAPSPFLAQ